MSNLEKRALRAGSFVHNNGKVLRTVNILRLKYNKLTGVQSVLEDDGIAEDEFLDSVNFLAEEGYIHLRRISNKEPAALADTDYTALEAKLTGKGRLQHRRHPSAHEGQPGKSSQQAGGRLLHG